MCYWEVFRKGASGTPGASLPARPEALRELSWEVKLFPGFPAMSTSVSHLTTAVRDVVKSQNGQLEESGDNSSGLEQILAFHFIAQKTPTKNLFIQTHTQIYLLLLSFLYVMSHRDSKQPEKLDASPICHLQFSSGHILKSSVNNFNIFQHSISKIIC